MKLNCMNGMTEKDSPLLFSSLVPPPCLVLWKSRNICCNSDRMNGKGKLGKAAGERNEWVCSPRDLIRVTTKLHS